MQGLAINHIVWPAGDRRLDMTLVVLKGLASMSLRALDPPRPAPAAEPQNEDSSRK
jgi:hypothetical protein